MYGGVPRGSDILLTSLMNRAPQDRRVITDLTIYSSSPNTDPSYSLGPNRDREPMKDTDVSRLGQMVDSAYREIADIERQRSEDPGYPLA